ncbi:hypothetical protein G6F40_015927 [Rhizopus arrhizus]|nr:hypothetical protein G6F40_015927 [Rhizopus arrhizus]
MASCGVPTLTSAAMRSFSITMSTGPQGGAPVPSMIFAPRRISLGNGPRPRSRETGADGGCQPLAALTSRDSSPTSDCENVGSLMALTPPVRCVR